MENKTTKREQNKEIKNENLNNCIGDLYKFIEQQADDFIYQKFDTMIRLLKDGKTTKNKSNDLKIIDLTIFEPLAKFSIYENAKYETQKAFLDFFKALLDTERNVKSLEVLRYENFKKAIDLLEKVFLKELKEVKYTPENCLIDWNDPTISLIYDLYRNYHSFLNNADEILAKAKQEKEIYEKTQSIQVLKDTFNNEMLNLCEFYQIEAETPFKSASFANTIIKLLDIKEN